MIHYHGLPMTPKLAMLRAMRSRHVMVSFEYPSQINDAAEIAQSFVLDNGAFSAWRAGRAANFDGFVEWVDHWRFHPGFDWALIPDVIDGTEEDNDALLRRWPFARHSVPVYHLHESLERLNRLVLEYPRVALGSSGVYAQPGNDAWWARMSEVMRVACDSDGRPITKLHGLRMLDPVLFSHLPLASADSCNVARNIGIDSKWDGPYSPPDPETRAIILADRIEAHATARRWCSTSSGTQQNLDLIG